jgi:hypothetical protein
VGSGELPRRAVPDRDPLDRERLSRDLRRRGQTALELLRGGLGEYAPKR